MISHLKPRRPYLFHAIYDWLLDNDLTPYMLVNAKDPNVQVPFEFVHDGKIVLNISPESVGNFSLGKSEIQFNARFSGVSQSIFVPMSAIIALYAKENGQGIAFENEPQYHQSNVDFFKEEKVGKTNENQKNSSIFKVIK